MVNFSESTISAHHNYLVNDMLTPGFVVGDPNSSEGFYFLADLVLPGESTPRISARLVDKEGKVLVELRWNRIGQNACECTYQAMPDGFRILNSSKEELLEVRTMSYPNGYLTRIKATLPDEDGRLRIEPLGESIRVHGEANLKLDEPFLF